MESTQIHQPSSVEGIEGRAAARAASALLKHSDLNNELHQAIETLVQALISGAQYGNSCMPITEADYLQLQQASDSIPWLVEQGSSAATTQTSTRALIFSPTTLWLRRYFEAELHIEHKLRALSAKQATPIDEEALINRLNQLNYVDDINRPAIISALKNHLTIITGGPGTGKTTIVIRVLALLIEQLRLEGRGAQPTIAVLAPTGKASARLKESVVKQKNDWLSDLRGFEREVIEKIPSETQTVHKFLRINPTTGKSRFQDGKTAKVDVVVVDEASMLDVTLFAQLLSALPDGVRLICLGDPYQLSSVETGNVLANIVEHARDNKVKNLSGCFTELTYSHRFPDSSDIGRLAKAINGGSVRQALAVLKDPECREAVLDEEPLERAARGYDLYRDAVKAFKKTPAEDSGVAELSRLFEAFGQWQVFSPFRNGPLGVSGLNDAIEAKLNLGSKGTWYLGRPVIILNNEPGLGLFNGDIGICTNAERQEVSFPAIDNDGNLTFHSIHAMSLPAHESVYAMTVHKSQGSEYDKCLLVVPQPSDRQQTLLTREILYTAITRAKKTVFIAARDEEIARMIATKNDRASGLFEKSD